MCDSCLRKIEAGTTYHRSRCVDGGDAWTWKSHPACQRAGDILWDMGIRGEEDCLINVIDMDQEDRELVYANDPETFRQVWPDRPEPKQPT
ncbi:hypothetical protein CEW89_08580 [Celeribacter ethanolicus]|uniref:Uncharacterized protein n=2 Tax=Celeribacter ethanolicus TaxID=1758178 RepID=A0A291GC42_9RHOB|nr:hypothetical protein CEW89_08580 [Celeribacter ethanolicus]